MYSRSLRFLATLVVASPCVTASAETINGASVEVLGRSTVKLPDRTVTYIRIRPPALPAPLPAPRPAPAEPTAEELATEARLAAKEHKMLSLNALTYAGNPFVTELSWTRASDGRRFVAYSNVPFIHLTQLSQIETATTVYQWFPFVSEADPGTLPAGVREALASGGAEPQYLFEGDENDATAEESTLQALDFLHAHFELNKDALIAATAQRQAEAEARERQAALDAAKPKQQTIYFWKNENPTAQ